MTSQINISNEHLGKFIECCEQLQIIYHQIEARQYDTRYEVVIASAAINFYLGVSMGLKMSHAIHTETLDQLQNGK